MKRSSIGIPGYRLKAGKLVKRSSKTSVSEKIRQRKSKRIKPAKKGALR